MRSKQQQLADNSVPASHGGTVDCPTEILPIGSSDAAAAGPFPTYVPFDRGLNTREAADFLGVRPHSLENRRTRCSDPKFYRVGRSVRYALSELIRYRNSQTRSSTSDHGGPNV